MKFETYCLALTTLGYRVLNSRAFLFGEFPWAVLIESEQDEEIFLQFCREKAWLIRSAHKAGYGLG